MRYVSKVYVMDVMDQVVVSGYIHETPDPPCDSPEVYEFTFQVSGMGLDDPFAWLQNAVYRALVSEQHPPRGGQETGVPMGGPHTISETGDSR